jgi:hypothetical protein
MSVIPNQTMVAIMAGPLNPPILGDFEAVLARKSPRIRPFGHRRKGGWGAVRQGLLHQFLDLVLGDKQTIIGNNMGNNQTMATRNSGPIAPNNHPRRFIIKFLAATSPLRYLTTDCFGIPLLFSLFFLTRLSARKINNLKRFSYKALYQRT